MESSYAQCRYPKYQYRTNSVFIAVAKLNSFTKAAQQFHLTQSAISKKIASLEQQLDMPLFIRGNKNIALTPAGKYLYDEWKVFADQVEFRIKMRTPFKRISAQSDHSRTVFI